jgi:anthranilate phosphoribosyltransferase
VKTVLNSLFEGDILDSATARRAMELALDRETPAEQVAAFLSALQVRNETPEELAAFLDVILERSIEVKTRRSDLVDTCGTGGDSARTFNISTTAAFVLAGAGVAVAKHGNRSSSSRCGSADVWEALGISLPIDAAAASAQIDLAGLGYLFAPTFHPSLAGVAGVRKKMGVRTVFNLLGPLANPARVTRQLVGVYSPRLTRRLAEVLLRGGRVQSAMVVSSASGMDEVSTCGNTHVAHLQDGKIFEYVVAPEDFGLARSNVEDLCGGDAAANAEIAVGILAGSERGPRRDAVLANVAAALIVAGRADSFRDGVGLAEASLDSGAALTVLSKLREHS